jgi:pyrroline-5-carboxylate reductase
MWSQVKETVILAVKPQILSTVIEEVVDMLPIEPSPLMISILAGVSLKQLENSFPGVSIVRAMPNTPATVGAGMTAISCGGHLQPGHHHIATRIFQAIGEVVEVSESLMDAVTGLSGSGPAYVALMVEALADGGVASGLPRAVAKQLALHTVLGSAKLIAETNIHPAELKDQVTSPGGTTIAGVRELERAGFRSAVIEAVKAATERSRELGVY